MSAANALEAAKQKWQDAREQAESARISLEYAIRDASKAGMSQSEIARILGWPRQRVNVILRS